jgi:prepilin-type N-terminal cleavage/methylation domain-containing protein
MKAPRGYTLLELLITVGILSTLAGISLTSIAAPQRMLEKEAMVARISSNLDRVQMQALLTGHPTTLSWTPWVLWQDEKKLIEFEQNGPWQWGSSIQNLQIRGDASLSLTDSRGRMSFLPQTLSLTYNQKQVALVAVDPQTGSLEIIPP